MKDDKDGVDDFLLRDATAIFLGATFASVSTCVTSKMAVTDRFFEGRRWLGLAAAGGASPASSNGPTFEVSFVLVRVLTSGMVRETLATKTPRSSSDMVARWARANNAFGLIDAPPPSAPMLLDCIFVPDNDNGMIGEENELNETLFGSERRGVTDSLSFLTTVSSSIDARDKSRFPPWKVILFLTFCPPVGIVQGRFLDLFSESVDLETEVCHHFSLFPRSTMNDFYSTKSSSFFLIKSY